MLSYYFLHDKKGNWAYTHNFKELIQVIGECGSKDEEDTVVLICPSVTRWTAHERCCKSIWKGYRQFFSSLVLLYTERREPEALGLLIQLSSPEILCTVLMLMEVFEHTGPLGLVLQKADLCLTDLPM